MIANPFVTFYLHRLIGIASSSRDNLQVVGIWLSHDRVVPESTDVVQITKHTLTPTIQTKNRGTNFFLEQFTSVFLDLLRNEYNQGVSRVVGWESVNVLVARVESTSDPDCTKGGLWEVRRVICEAVNKWGILKKKTRINIFPYALNKIVFHRNLLLYSNLLQYEFQ